MKYTTNCRSREIIVTIIAIAIVISMLFIGTKVLKIGQTEYVEELDGETRTVASTQINFREEPWGNIIGTLKKGQKVELTGNRQEATIGSPKSDFWYEVYADGTTGWVSEDGIK